MPVIRIVAALIVDEQQRVLLVRKAGTTVFMQPGGKYEPGETARQALVRELHEELGLVVAEAQLEHLGSFEAVAANEAGHTVEAEVFKAPLTGTPGVQAEIVELLWVLPAASGHLAIAPLTTDRIFPLLIAAAEF